MMYISQGAGIGALRQCSNLSSPLGELYIIGLGYDFGVDKSAGFVQSRNQLEPS